MSDLGTQDDPIFKGRTPGGISCAEFVRAVRKHAITEKKTRDDEYIADYVMSCLDEEALDWSETLSKEVQGDWSLLRRALLAEYRGAGGQTGPPSAATIPNAMIPIPAAASPIPLMQNSLSVPTLSNAIATAPVPPQISPAQSSSQAVTVRAGTPNIHRGRIGMKAGISSYYASLQDGVPAKCEATRDISKAAIVEAIEANGIIEFRFTGASSSGTKWLGMVWKSPFTTKVGNHAALFWVERLGSTVNYPEEMDRKDWAGAVNIVKWTSSINNALTPTLNGREDLGTLAMKQFFGIGWNASSLYITNDFGSFATTYPLEASRVVKLIFEPI